MVRKKLFFGLGVASGSAALVGSGAFSSVQAERNVSVEVVGDKSAFLALQPTEGPNGQYASISDNGMLEVKVSEDNEDVSGEGINPNSFYDLGKVFKITNQGTQSVGVWIEHDSKYVDFKTGGKPLDDSSSPVLVDEGKSLTVRILVDTHDYDGEDESLLESIAIHAEADPDRDEPDPPDVSVTRTLTHTEVKSGNLTTVTLTISIPNSTDLDIFERFDTGLGTASFESATSEDENLSPSFVDFSDGGGIVLFDEVPPGTITVKYSIQTTSSTPVGVYQFNPNLIGTDEMSVTINGSKRLEVV